MLLGKSLVVQPLVERRPGVMIYGKPTFLCVKCQANFVGFKGMVRRGKGLGYCLEHTPKKESDDVPTQKTP
jgi:hypothetical protein